jgi:glycerol kinase
VKGARRLADSGRLLFGTVDTWLVWNFTRGAVHVTDASNASRTLLYNIHRGEWDADLLALFDIPASMLPQVKSSSEVYAVMRNSFFAGGVPVSGIIADQQAALFGLRCVSPGMVKCSCGTSCFVMMNTGPRPILSKNDLLTTIAWSVNGEVVYALEGGLFMAEASLEWLRDGLGLVRKTSDIEALAATVKNNGGVYMVPAFSGLGAPYWNRHARGTLVGLTCDSNAGHLCRAVFEGIAYQTNEVLKMMASDAGLSVSSFRADGRMTENNLLMQFQSDILGLPISRSRVGESMALGAAYCAGLAVGYWSGQ